MQDALQQCAEQGLVGHQQFVMNIGVEQQDAAAG